jgi:hypothetical protein
MTLKENFESSDLLISRPKRVLKQIKIAEDFAIGFAEWCVIRKVSFFDDTEQGMIFTVDLYKTKYTTKQLLEIYKIEKGL